MSLSNTFGLSEEQEMVRENVLALLEQTLPWDRIREMDDRVADLMDGGQDVAGYSTEYDMAMFFRDARVLPIGGGATRSSAT